MLKKPKTAVRPTAPPSVEFQIVGAAIALMKAQKALIMSSTKFQLGLGLGHTDWSSFPRPLVLKYEKAYVKLSELTESLIGE